MSFFVSEEIKNIISPELIADDNPVALFLDDRKMCNVTIHKIKNKKKKIIVCKTSKEYSIYNFLPDLLNLRGDSIPFVKIYNNMLKAKFLEYKCDTKNNYKLITLQLE